MSGWCRTATVRGLIPTSRISTCRRSASRAGRLPLLTKTLLFVSEGDPIMVRTPPGAGPDAGKGFRAFDKETGAVVWETTFPAGTNGSPITYMHDGTQYIVLPIGSIEHPGEWIALALP